MNTLEYNSCVQDYTDGIYRYALKLMEDQMDAEDIVQEVFEALWIHHVKVDRKKAKAYLFKSAYHAMMDQFRKRKLHLKVVDHFTGSFDGYQDQSVVHRDLLEHAFRGLPQHLKMVILLRDYEGYSYREIGDLTGLTEAQVKTNIFRGRQHLRKTISQLNEGPAEFQRKAKSCGT